MEKDAIHVRTSNICITNYACMHVDLFHYREEQCPFEREFIRKVVKEMEVSVTFIVCYFYTSTFHILSLQ